MEKITFKVKYKKNQVFISKENLIHLEAAVAVDASVVKANVLEIGKLEIDKERFEFITLRIILKSNEAQ